MASKNIEIKVGLLVVVSILILIGAIYLAKGYSYGQKFYSVSAWFPEVGALSTGDLVSVSGVNKGKVKELSLSEGGVLVRMDVAVEVALKEDAQFTVKNIGLMGERFIAVKPGTSEQKLDLTRPATGGFDAGIPEVMGIMGEVIARVNDLVSLLQKTVISPATLDKFSETVTSLRAVTSNLENATDRNVPKIDNAINDFAALAHNVRVGLERNTPYIDTGAQNFAAASQQLRGMLADMETASSKLKTFAQQLEESDGTLRMLMEDRRLYDDLRSTARNLDSLVNDVRQNPKKYIKFSVEIF
ncbi:MAG: MlaD family protein [candidate division Zixibacteria bacterium]|nr:MlaD family protein [candidate division Zixibacteria bacterium]